MELKGSETVQSWLDKISVKIVVGIVVSVVLNFGASYLANTRAQERRDARIENLEAFEKNTLNRHQAEDESRLQQGIFQAEVARSINALSVNQSRVLEKLKIQPIPYAVIQVPK